MFTIYDRIYMVFLSPSLKYRYAMLKAIDEARRPGIFEKEWESKTNGLLAIREFERINKLKFNPFLQSHVKSIASMAKMGVLIRKIKRLCRKIDEGKKLIRQHKKLHMRKLQNLKLDE